MEPVDFGLAQIIKFCKNWHWH